MEGFFMSIDENQELECVEPERAPAKLASGSTDLQSNAIEGISKPYHLYPTQEDFDLAYDTEEYRQSLNYKSLEHLRAPILDNITSQVWKDDPEIKVPVSGRKCCCRSVWCPDCFRFLYLDKIKKAFEPFDWRYTRQVVLTIDPANFPSPVEAFNHIRQKRAVGEFVRRLRRGVREKIGKHWVWKYRPVKILRWSWFLEWHKNNFPHFHVFLHLDKEGKSGMIGGDFLRDSWNLSSWVREDYFHSEKHFKNLTGYYTDKGYFEKNKQYQGILPDVIMDNVQGKIKRYGCSERSEIKKPELKTQGESVYTNLNFLKCIAFFEEMKTLNKIEQRGTPAIALNSIFTGLVNSFQHCATDRSINYRAILERCGAKTKIELDLKNYRVEAECNLSYDQWKSKPEGKFFNGRGIVRKLNLKEISELLSSTTRVISIKEYMDIYDYCRKRDKKIANKEYWRNQIMMQRD